MREEKEFHIPFWVIALAMLTVIGILLLIFWK